MNTAHEESVELEPGVTLVKRYPVGLPSRPQTNIGLSKSRVVQLQALAEAWGVSQADAIGRMINAQIEAGILPRALPGVTIKTEGEAVLIGFDGAEPITVSKTAANDLARSIRVRAGVSDLAAGAFEFVERQWPDPGLSPTRVDRRGRGVIVRVGTARRTFALMEAKEIADLIEAAAA